MFSVRCIDQTIARTEPENLIFADHKKLREIARNKEDYSEQIRIRSVTELAGRYLLDPAQDSGLNEILGNIPCLVLSNLVQARLLCANGIIPDSLWKDQSGFAQKAERYIREKVQELFCNTDGYIPVYCRSGNQTETENAYFIPFHLEPVETTSQVCDLHGTVHEEWTAFFRQLPITDENHYRCVLHLSFSQKLAATSLIGNSCMLPIFLALMRKQKCIAQYHPERLIASGAFRNGLLEPVDVTAKISAFQKRFPDAVFCCPQSDPPVPEHRSIKVLPLGIGTTDILKRITKYIEADGLFIPSLKYAARRLPQIEHDVRYTNYNNWHILTKVIANLEKGVDPDRSPEQYLIMQMLKSVAACHNGNTDDAIRYNREACSFARENGFIREALRLDVEQLVDLLDMENFPLIKSIAETLEPQLKDAADPDLLMRYYGTMGQIQAYGALTQCEGFTAENALVCFRNALQYAFRTDSEQDIAQDRNYIHLWHALFQPGTGKECSTFQNALHHIQYNLADEPENQFRNLCFLKRQKDFAGYRYLLANKTRCENTKFPVPLNGQPDDWLAALYKKYEAATAAAGQESDRARSLFDAALQDLDLKHCEAIKAFIRMTICAEAYRSLQLESYLAEGLQSFERYPQIRNYATAARWETYLRHPGENTFPGLEYWY